MRGRRPALPVAALLLGALALLLLPPPALSGAPAPADARRARRRRLLQLHRARAHLPPLDRAMAALGGDEEGALSPEIDIHAVPPEGPLLLPGRKFPLDFEGGGLAIAGAPLRIGEQPNTGLGTGLTIWDGSVVLAKYLEHRAAQLGLAAHSVLELGAGTGVVGLAAAAAGAPHVTLTDLPYALPNARANVARNAGVLRGARVEVAPLDWYAPALPAGAPPPTLVVGADVVWVTELIPPLVRALAAVCGAGSPPAPALIAHQTRSRAGDALFAAELRAAGFRVERVPWEEHHPAFRDGDIAILRLTLRQPPGGGGGGGDA